MRTLQLLGSLLILPCLPPTHQQQRLDFPLSPAPASHITRTNSLLLYLITTSTQHPPFPFPFDNNRFYNHTHPTNLERNLPSKQRKGNTYLPPTLFPRHSVSAPFNLSLRSRRILSTRADITMHRNRIADIRLNVYELNQKSISFGHSTLEISCIRLLANLPSKQPQHAKRSTPSEDFQTAPLWISSCSSPTLFLSTRRSPTDHSLLPLTPMSLYVRGKKTTVKYAPLFPCNPIDTA